MQPAGGTDERRDDRAAVAAAVRGYFAAWAAGEPTRPYAVGPLALADALFAPTRAPGVVHSVDIDDLEIEQLGNDAAVVSFAASWNRRRAGKSHTTRLHGPVELRREDGAWRIVLFYRDGWPVVPILVDGREAKDGPITARARVVDFRRSGTYVVLEARNDSDEPARFVGVDVPSHRFVMADGSALPTNVLRGPLPPHQTVFRAAIVPTLVADRDRDRLELKVHVEHGRMKRRLTIRALPG